MCNHHGPWYNFWVQLTVATMVSPNNTRNGFAGKRPKCRGPKRIPPVNYPSSKVHHKAKTPTPQIMNIPDPVNCKTLQRTQGANRENHGKRSNKFWMNV